MAVINVPGNLDGKIMKAVTKDYGIGGQKTVVKVEDVLDVGRKIAKIVVDGESTDINQDISFEEFLKSVFEFDYEKHTVKSFKFSDSQIDGLIYKCYVDGGKFTLSAYEDQMEVDDASVDNTKTEILEVKNT